jgi:two-component system, NarL family, response regulator DevR
MNLRVLIVDDHELVRQGLRSLFRTTDDIVVVGDAGTGAEAVRAAHDLTPDIVLLDIRLPDQSGIDICRDITAALPEVRCLMFTSHDDEQAVYAALMAGASGYLLKDSSGRSLIEAVRSVGAGRSLLDPAVTAGFLDRLRTGSAPTPDSAESLNSREQQLLSLITEGLTNKQIAARLFLAEKTIKNYVSALLAKLGYQRRTQIAVFGASLRDHRSASAFS